MATIKSYTDLEQSKKLAEILPLESADMFWRHCNLDNLDYPIMQTEFEYIRNANTPCWSLASLLCVLPKSIIYTPNPALDGYCCKNIMHDLETYGENPVDACYEMIIKLHELKIL